MHRKLFLKHRVFRCFCWSFSFSNGFEKFLHWFSLRLRMYFIFTWVGQITPMILYVITRKPRGMYEVCWKTAVDHVVSKLWRNTSWPFLVQTFGEINLHQCCTSFKVDFFSQLRVSRIKNFVLHSTAGEEKKKYKTVQIWLYKFDTQVWLSEIRRRSSMHH